ncbi:MAG: FecR domain-containing protein [Pseudomonadota bacterium]
MQDELDIHHEAHLWRARIDEGLNSAEKVEFDSWMSNNVIHRAAFAEAESMWATLGRVEYHSLQSASPVIESEGNARPWIEIANDNFRSLGPRIAAAAIALAMAVGILTAMGFSVGFGGEDLPERQHFAASSEGAKLINLPDGSRITLSPNSRLNLSYAQDLRDVRLTEGSARFAVSKDPDRPFVVSTRIADIRVTGTKFSTILRDGGLEVGVLEGSVQVQPPVDAENGTKKIALTAGQNIWTDDGIDYVAIKPAPGAGSLSANSSVPTRPAVAPEKTERLKYVSAPLSSVVGDINRYGTVPIDLDPSLSDLRLSGTFKTSEADLIVNVIEEALPVVVVQQNGKKSIVPE